ncbi:hypothetical protein E7T06_07185 [Deinococcus sp. Arct2-2]|uniref:hypothetical protein n=1 Tax=Deinococcus sp. Arct2-2 TaxID=2568653 RepID=UPI0010A38571|nr:hypothetical protein [Deinococcus sp. Arct2-2]THF70482.1 hypothetical protein E7T06_07185 [Deinococcus sp. Arct2-2]
MNLLTDVRPTAPAHSYTLKPMQALRQYFQTEARNWWGTPVINQFLILLSSIFLLLSWVEAVMPGGPPGITWGDLFTALFVICFALNSALEANRTPTSKRRRAFIWGCFAFGLLFMGAVLFALLSRS